MIILILTEPEETGCTFTLEPWENTSGTPAGSYSITEVSPSKYESSNITGLSGEWVILMKNGANEPVFSGFILFSSAAKGKATEDPTTALNNIQSKTSIIGTGSVSWTAPVLETGQLSGPIIIGDDYLASVNRAFDWFVEPLPISVGQATCFFGGKSASKPPGWNVQGTVSEVIIESQVRWRLRFELPRSVTSQLKAGLYSWSAEVRGSSSQVTRVLGSINVVPKQTA